MEKEFSSKSRNRILEKMADEQYDLFIIGGGITGAGIALDASTRGMKTAMVDMQDFAGGTSSRSTKLVHGGLRYLKQFEVKMVSEVGKERAIVYENGPHVTTPEWMVLPIYKGGTFGKFSTSIGLRMYDFLAGVKRAERRKMLSTQDVLKKEPLLKKEGLRGGGYYVEYRTDDARLTIEVIKEAVVSGADALNYTKVEELLYEEDRIIGVKVKDLLSERTFRIFANKVINATGPWVDTIREKDQSKSGKSLQLTKGVHFVIDKSRFPLKQAIYFDTMDNRMIFAIPRDGKTYVGTTDTVYEGDIINPRMAASDRSYLIEAINHMFPSLKLKETDIESSWSGLRPLIHQDGKSPSEISRKDEIWISQSGLISIAGGKLTGYRKMAEEIVDQVSTLFKAEGKDYPKCKTREMPISGGKVGGSKNFQAFKKQKVVEGEQLGLTRKEAIYLVSMYGSNVNTVYAIIKRVRGREKSLDLPIILYAQLLYAIDYEMTATPVDFFIRRTGALYFNIDLVRKWKNPVNKVMQQTLNWSNQKASKYSNELDNRMNEVNGDA